jgi:DNA-binding MarR family transcriptional regulator
MAENITNPDQLKSRIMELLKPLKPYGEHVSDIADQLGCDESSVTLALDELEKGGKVRMVGISSYALA